MKIIRRKSFDKSLSVLHKKIITKAIETLEIFTNNYQDSRLRNHALHKQRSGYRSIDVTGDYRIIFRELSDGLYELVELIDIGTHSQLYG